MTDEAAVGGADGLADDHYIALLAVALRWDGGVVTGNAPVRPELFVPGSTTIRTANLTTMVDLVAGHVPAGPIGPTVDLRVEVLAPNPVEGRIHLHGRPLRVGRRLVVSETLLSAEPGGAPFARAVTTFLNVSLGAGSQRDPFPAPPVPAASFDDYIGARVRDDRSLELHPRPHVANDFQGTVQGGVQALLAELAAAHVLGGGPHVAADLDIRYLSKLGSGPLVAVADVVARSEHGDRVAVALVDGDDPEAAGGPSPGEPGRLVGYVTARMVPAR